jgi:hypothetical protein
MSHWNEHQIEDRVTQILSEVPDAYGSHHFGRAYLTAYQLAIEFFRRFPEAAAAIGLPLGGRGTGQHSSLAQYLARELSGRIKTGEITCIEGGFLSDQHLRDINFLNGQEVIYSSLTGTGYTLSMYRLTHEGQIESD